MFDALLNTTKNSLQDLLGSTIKIIPALLTALIIVMLTSYGVKFVQQITTNIAEKTVQNRSLQILLIKVVLQLG